MSSAGSQFLTKGRTREVCVGLVLTRGEGVKKLKIGRRHTVYVYALNRTRDRCLFEKRHLKAISCFNILTFISRKSADCYDSTYHSVSCPRAPRLLSACVRSPPNKVLFPRSSYPTGFRSSDPRSVFSTSRSIRAHNRRWSANPRTALALVYI